MRRFRLANEVSDNWLEVVLAQESAEIASVVDEDTSGGGSEDDGIVRGRWGVG